MTTTTLTETKKFNLLLPEFDGQISTYTVYTVTDEQGTDLGHLVKGIHLSLRDGSKKTYWRVANAGNRNLTAGVTSKQAALRKLTR